MRRALKPGASLGVIWNIEDCRPLPISHAQIHTLTPTDNKPASWSASTPWEQSLNDLIFSLKLDGNPRFRNEQWKTVFLEQRGPDGTGEEIFETPLLEKSFPWTVWVPVETLRLRMQTLSQVAVLEGEAKEAYEKRFDEIMGADSVERDEEGRVPVSGVTFYACAKRT